MAEGETVVEGCGLRDCRELSSCEDFLFEGRHLSGNGTKVREVELHEVILQVHSTLL